jgi:hypothetical protein
MSTTPATAEEIHTRAGGLLGALASGDFGVASQPWTSLGLSRPRFPRSRKPIPQS